MYIGEYTQYATKKNSTDISDTLGKVGKYLTLARAIGRTRDIWRWLGMFGDDVSGFFLWGGITLKTIVGVLLVAFLFCQYFVSFLGNSNRMEKKANWPRTVIHSINKILSILNKIYWSCTFILVTLCNSWLNRYLLWKPLHESKKYTWIQYSISLSENYLYSTSTRRNKLRIAILWTQDMSC